MTSVWKVASVTSMIIESRRAPDRRWRDRRAGRRSGSRPAAGRRAQRAEIDSAAGQDRRSGTGIAHGCLVWHAAAEIPRRRIRHRQQHHRHRAERPAHTRHRGHTGAPANTNPSANTGTRPPVSHQPTSPATRPTTSAATADADMPEHRRGPNPTRRQTLHPQRPQLGSATPPVHRRRQHHAAHEQQRDAHHRDPGERVTHGRSPPIEVGTLRGDRAEPVTTRPADSNRDTASAGADFDSQTSGSVARSPTTGTARSRFCRSTMTPLPATRGSTGIDRRRRSSGWARRRAGPAAAR